MHIERAWKSIFEESFFSLFEYEKPSAESHGVLVGASDEHALVKWTCQKWYGRWKEFEDEELEVFLDEDYCHTR